MLHSVQNIIVSSYFLYVDASETEDYQWFLPVRSRTKSKKMRKRKKDKKRILKKLRTRKLLRVLVPVTLLLLMRKLIE